MGKMIRRRLQNTRGRFITAVGAYLGVLAVGVTLTGCIGDLLEVQAPASVLAEDLGGPETAELLVVGAVGDFECAFAAYITTTGLLTDELTDTQLRGAESWDPDRRTPNPEGLEYSTEECTSYGAIYRPLATARWVADDAINKLDGFSDAEVADRGQLIATAAAYSGYGHLLLGEGFCTAAIDGGSELTPADLFALAETKFTRAITEAQGAGDTDIENMALVGRARARLNLGMGAQAMADALLVPAGFVKNATYSAASVRAYNRVFDHNARSLRLSIDPAYRNLEFQSVPDPRVPVFNTGLDGVDRFNIVWATTKYTSLVDPIPIARWEEAQLIIAEVAGGATALAIIDALHAQAGLPSFSGTNPTATQITDHIMLEERRRELFLESHHLYDMRRFDLPFLPPAGTPYPDKGGFYGTATCFPLPDVERDNNPNL